MDHLASYNHRIYENDSSFIHKVVSPLIVLKLPQAVMVNITVTITVISTYSIDAILITMSDYDYNVYYHE